MVAREKLLAKAGAEEIKIILGWILNFRTLTIALSENKYVAWKVAILEILEAVNTPFKELEQMNGRLVHLGIVLPSVYHFMSRLRELLRKLAKREKDKSEHQFDRRPEINVVFIGVSTHSLKFDFLRHTSEVELFVIGRLQYPETSLLAIISIQVVIIVAKCSRRVFEVQSFNHKRCKISRQSHHCCICPSLQGMNMICRLLLVFCKPKGSY